MSHNFTNKPLFRSESCWKYTTIIPMRMFPAQFQPIYFKDHPTANSPNSFSIKTASWHQSRCFSSSLLSFGVSTIQVHLHSSQQNNAVGQKAVQRFMCCVWSELNKSFTCSFFFLSKCADLQAPETSCYVTWARKKKTNTHSGPSVPLCGDYWTFGLIFFLGEIYSKYFF